MADRKIRKKKTASSGPVKTFFKVFITVLLVGVIVAFVCLTGAVASFIFSTPSINPDNIDLDFTSIVYYNDPVTGKPVEYEHLYKNENRQWADLADIPVYVQKAAIAIEDERFYTHIGFDVKSTTKAVYNYIFKGSTSRGASTITQQLIKNLTGEGEKTPFRKIQEIIRAITLETQLSKDQILELYLNTIYLSQGCSGLTTASDYYFGKPVSDLTVAEGACLIGITQYPTLYDPILNPEKNKEKQEIVLKKMFELGYIDQQEYDEAVQQQLDFKPAKGENIYEGKQSYFVDEIVRQVLGDLQNKLGYSEDEATKMLYADGLKIYSTLDPVVQGAIDSVYADDNNFPKAPGDVQPQSSMTVIDHETGYVRGLIGGRGTKSGDRVLNRATQSTRQPGSTIKPIAVYAPAIEKKLISPGSVYTDKKVTYGSWSPKNYYSGFRGSMTVRYAVQISANTVPVQILNKMGADVAYDYLKNNLGITSLVEQDKSLASLALGGLTKGVSNLELTAAYASFANKGKYNKPVLYTKIEDANGNIILENTPEPVIAFSEQTANMMTDMLVGVVKSGTGTVANFSGKYSIAGKTGTTDNDVDRWFVGMTPYYTASVWIGFDTPKSMSFINANPTVPIWKKVMQKIHESKALPSKYFAAGPGGGEDGAPKKSYCIDSGLLPTNKCIEAGRVQTDYFPNGTEPKSYCTLEHEGEGDSEENSGDEGQSSDSPKTSSSPDASSKPAASAAPKPSPGTEASKTYRICSASGLLATQYCPPELVISSTTAPGGTCGVHLRD